MPISLTLFENDSILLNNIFNKELLINFLDFWRIDNYPDSNRTKQYIFENANDNTEQLCENFFLQCRRKEQAYKSRSLVFYIPSACHHRPIFLSLRKLKSSSMYIRDKTIYADYQIKRKKPEIQIRFEFFHAKRKIRIQNKGWKPCFRLSRNWLYLKVIGKENTSS